MDADENLTEEDLAFFLRWRRIPTPATDAQLAASREHILRVWRQLGSSGFVYNCMRSLAFLRPHVHRHPAYPALLARLAAAAPGTFRVADVGCALGQETRALLADGVPAAAVLATDLSDRYWDAGKQFFDNGPDAGSGGGSGGASEPPLSVAGVETAFGDWAAPLEPSDGGGQRDSALSATGLSPTGGGVVESDVAAPYAGAFDAILSMLVLHVLSRDQQLLMLRRLALCGKPGALLIGCCIASEHAPGVWPLLSDPTALRWLQTAASLEAALREAGWTANVSVKAVPRESLEATERGAARGRYDLTEEMGQMQVVIFSAELPAAE